MVAKYSPLMWFSVFRYRSRSSLAPTGLYLALNLSKRWKVCLPFKETTKRQDKRFRPGERDWGKDSSIKCWCWCYPNRTKKKEIKCYWCPELTVVLKYFNTIHSDIITLHKRIKTVYLFLRFSESLIEICNFSSFLLLTYSMHIQWVHGEIIRVQIEGSKELLHCDFFAFQFVHNTVSIHTVRFLDEAQQVLLVHAGCSMDVGVYLGRQSRRESNLRDMCAIPMFGHKGEMKTRTTCISALSEESNSNLWLIKVCSLNGHSSV